jgi:signal peptidase I
MPCELSYNSRALALQQGSSCETGPILSEQGRWMQADQEPKSRTKSAFREVVETIVFTLLIYFLVRTFLFENYRVVGSSMFPTLEDNQFLVVNKLAYRLQQPQRGDIIVFRDPHDKERKLIKRVIGLPGDVLEVRQGQVFVNDQRLEEPYIQDPARYSRPPSSVPDGQYFVLGDNRNNSSDSSNWGTLPRENIVGKAWLSYWPPPLWGVIPHETYGNVP